ncbi:WYL domain-containing protein [Pseudorhodobacter sp.]|uniref:WYL domain-containing protein n=1 Tax=Pseudorhodobacter sp. TaxID=1934400 RepID=UPI0026487DA7|nr:WYL domain-containing protein [Pseudorhodobacter sp.]MDN5785809.1 WYL domain-containing protein [Pseudorhodobacter sp.]
MLCRLYRALDVRPSSYYRTDMPAAQTADLAQLHAAIADCRPVRFDYTDLAEQESSRSVLPLALVHPPQGVKLLAWCQKTEGYRQFFVRMMRGIAPEPGDFAQSRMALLQGLVEKEGA